MSRDATAIDSGWIAANPAPVHKVGTTKNSRGRVLAVGGSRMVPGALRLTGEAALRVGAGKLQMATVRSVALMLGLLVPEGGSIGLPEDDGGELADPGDALVSALNSCDAVVVGPGIGDPAAAARATEAVLRCAESEALLVVDALSIAALRDRAEALKPFAGRLLITPHHGEMAALTGAEVDAIAADPASHARTVARTYGAVVVLKGSDTMVAAPDGALLHYGGGGTGLATGGSGDVLAGAIAGLLSRGASPLIAAGWGVWLHGQSGRRVATTCGPIGFLAREVPAEFPKLLPQ
ncbi:hydroxyethylthiazole kinase-like uncharacterized protein yjeF [Sphingomonas jejuensis]|uniref:ADP-dependent (S)-NAD(P)H-hydrate dehydratase n=1 Tax=Sphingomonas jejuensis TaxID=904715 RepID=A0ABX0XKS0_9SPHN|nr:NAD(P)H-hydrate dehydratase [Sphingomonas jejuensis]NJC33376.1 hydroxyethylthiazole kinase-like uncharacterized protein yjeF [Sphingomonas jejuensis]